MHQNLLVSATDKNLPLIATWYSEEAQSATDDDFLLLRKHPVCSN